VITSDSIVHAPISVSAVHPPPRVFRLLLPSHSDPKPREASSSRKSHCSRAAPISAFPPSLPSLTYHQSHHLPRPVHQRMNGVSWAGTTRLRRGSGVAGIDHITRGARVRELERSNGACRKQCDIDRAKRRAERPRIGRLESINPLCSATLLLGPRNFW
jgi:hypothetical protein